MSDPVAKMIKDVLAGHALAMSVFDPAPRGTSCPHCGFFNHADSDVRDAGDDQQHCANCGELFERNL